MDLSYEETVQKLKELGEIDEDQDKRYSISKELKEIYSSGVIITCDNKLNISIDMSNMFHNPPYIRFFDNSIPEKSSYCARISLLGSEYIECHDSTIPTNILTQRHKDILIKYFNTHVDGLIWDNWAMFRMSCYDTLRSYDQYRMAEIIYNLPKPDYTNLPTR